MTGLRTAGVCGHTPNKTGKRLTIELMMARRAEAVWKNFHNGFSSSSSRLLDFTQVFEEEDDDMNEEDWHAARVMQVRLVNGKQAR